MRYLYTVIFYMLIPLIFIRLYIRGAKNPGYRQAWPERFGYTPWTLDRSIWFHIVSLGEAIAAQPVIEYVLARYPDKPLVITNTTPTGRAHIRKIFSDRVYNCYFPYDLPAALARFVRRVNPAALFIMETELWPNLQHVCYQKNISVLLANARLSKRSFERYRRFPQTARDLMRAMKCVAAQYDSDAKHFEQLGLAKKYIHVTGSIKFDKTLPEELMAQADKIKALWVERPVWIAASTHDGEDEIVLQAHQQFLLLFPDALLILVPRHPERFDKVARLARQSFKVVKRSSGQVCDNTTQVYLGDTIGEMMTLYAASQIAFVAGSFKPIGGHNILEPALLGLPILTGPSMYNFAKISQMLTEAGASKIVTDADALVQELALLFKDRSRREKMGQSGLDIMDKNRGALKRLTNCIDNLLETIKC